MQTDQIRIKRQSGLIKKRTHDQWLPLSLYLCLSLLQCTRAHVQVAHNFEKISSAGKQKRKQKREGIISGVDMRAIKTRMKSHTTILLNEYFKKNKENITSWSSLAAHGPDSVVHCFSFWFRCCCYCWARCYPCRWRRRGCRYIPYCTHLRRLSQRSHRCRQAPH